MWPTIDPSIAPLWYYLCVGLAVLITGIGKAGFGGAVGVLAIPLMAMVMCPKHMLGIMLPVLIAADLLSNAHYFGARDWRLLRPMLLGSVMGVVIGTAVFWLLHQSEPQMAQRVLSAVIGGVCLFVVALQGYRLFGKEVPMLSSSPMSSAIIGLIAGVVSTISHTGGPIVTIYLLQDQLPKRVLVGTLLVYFLITNLVKVPTYVALGLINPQSLMDSIWLLPLLPLGTLVGAWMHKQVPQRPFVVIMYLGTVAGAIHLIHKAMA